MNELNQRPPKIIRKRKNKNLTSDNIDSTGYRIEIKGVNNFQFSMEFNGDISKLLSAISELSKHNDTP